MSPFHHVLSELTRPPPIFWFNNYFVASWNTHECQVFIAPKVITSSSPRSSLTARIRFFFTVAR